MGRKCNVKDCPSESNRAEDTGVTFHKMPTHLDLRPKWISLCCVPEDKKHHRVIHVCSRHFLRADFCNFKGTKYMLKQGALPSVFPWTKSVPKATKPPETRSKSDTDANKNVPKNRTADSKTVKENDKPLKVNVKSDGKSEKPTRKDTRSRDKLNKKGNKKDVVETKKKSSASTPKAVTRAKKAEVVKETDVVIKTEAVDDVPIDAVEPVASVSSNESEKVEDVIKTDIKEEFVIKDEDVDDKSVITDIKDEDKLVTADYPEDVKTEHVDEVVIEPKSDDSPPALMKFMHRVKPISKSKTPILNFVPGLKIEALDHKQSWYPAKVIEVDYEEHEVLIHFENFSFGYDEWIQMDSSRLRPLLPHPRKPVEIYVVGERCMATWSDSRKFPATISRVLDNDSYEVLFDDGYIKCLKHHKINKMTHVPDHLPATSTLREQAAPLFEPAKGSKQERRDRKRKHNVAELFHKKRPKLDTDEYLSPPVETVSTDTDTEEWTCRWINGEPVGEEAVIDTTDGQRRSIIVVDKRLPAGWNKHLSQRMLGNSAGKWDTIIISPEGRRFRSRHEVQKYLDDNHHLRCTADQFDFGLHIQRARKLGLYEMTSNRPKSIQSRARLSHGGSSASSVHDKFTEIPEVEVPKEEPSGLKIPMENDSYKCPIDGCGKNFRRENLAQMHVKHYHPEYSQFMGSTPNVADLAYARTVGESLEKPNSFIDRSRSALKVSTSRTPISTPKLLSPNEQDRMVTTTPTSVNKNKDSEIIKLLNKPTSFDIKTEGFDPSLTNDLRLRDLLCKPEVGSRFTSHEEPRIGGIKTLLPISRRGDSRDSKLPDEMLYDSDTLPKPHSSAKTLSARNVRRRRQAIDTFEPFKKKFDPMDQVEIKDESIAHDRAPSDVIIEGGEVIKIVHMRREEIINCTCGITEEDGLMIQCELCFCWQHAYCNGIERESQVPDKYICYICQHPVRMRSSKKYFHDQDWLKHGTLATANYHCKDAELLTKRFETLQKSHQLSGGLVELKDFIHSLRVKINIADAKNHPKLYLWSKVWDAPAEEKPELSDDKDKLNTSDHSFLKNDLENILNDSIVSDIKSEKDPEESMLMSILKSENNSKLHFPKIDLNTLMANNLDQLPAVQPPVIPQPEAAIETADCRLNLIEHIAHCQKQVDDRLNDFEAQIDLMESENLPNETEENYPKTKQTLLMLLKDLNTMKQLATLN